MNARFAKPCVCVLLINYLHFKKGTSTIFTHYYFTHTLLPTWP